MDSMIQFENGLTVRELKNILTLVTEEDRNGKPYTVWVMTSKSTSSIVTEVWPLNKRRDGHDIVLNADGF